MINKKQANKKTGQVWFTDFMLGLFIFVIVVFMYYEYAYSIDQSPNKISSDMIADAKAITSSLITQGSPEDWNSDNVNIIGITDGDQRIVPDKLDGLSNMNYTQMKSKLRTSYDLYLFLEEFDGTRITIDGEQGLGLEPSDYDNLVSIERIMVYNSNLIRMVVYVWQG